MKIASHKAQRGVSLVELMAVVAIAGIVAGSLIPSLSDAIARRRLDVAVAELRTGVQLARSEAVARNQSVRLKVESSSSGSCYVAHSGGMRDCSCGVVAPATCAPGAQELRRAQFGPAARLSLRSTSASMLFDAARGTVTPTGSLDVSNERGQTVRVVVNVMGRARACTPTPPLRGYQPC